MTNALVESVGEAIQPLSILLAIIIFLFGLRFPNFLKKLDESEKACECEKPAVCEYLTKELKDSQRIGLTPLIIICFIVCYTISPTVAKIVINSRLNLFDFNFVLTAFILISLFLYAILGYLVAVFVRYRKTLNGLITEGRKSKIK